MIGRRRLRALAFTCDHTLDEIQDLLNARGSLQWTGGDSERRSGGYLWALPGDDYSMMRIFEDGDRFVVDIEHLSGVEGAMSYEDLRKIVDKEILPTVGARDVEPHPGWEG